MGVPFIVPLPKVILNGLNVYPGSSDGYQYMYIYNYLQDICFLQKTDQCTGGTSRHPRSAIGNVVLTIYRRQSHLSYFLMDCWVDPLIRLWRIFTLWHAIYLQGGFQTGLPCSCPPRVTTLPPPRVTVQCSAVTWTAPLASTGGCWLCVRATLTVCTTSCWLGTTRLGWPHWTSTGYTNDKGRYWVYTLWTKMVATFILAVQLPFVTIQ